MSGRGRERGFSLVEIMVVMALIGLVLSLIVMRVEHLSPKYALRAAAREVGATIDLARGKAASSGLRTAIEYDVNQGVYQLYVQNRSGERGNGPWGLEPVGMPKELPRYVRLKGVYAHAKGREAQSGGVLRVRFDALSIEGSHIVYLENVDGKVMSVKYNALLGSCDYADGTAEFETAPE